MEGVYVPRSNTDFLVEIMSTLKMSRSQTDLIKTMYDERSEQYDASFHVLHAEEFIRIAQPKDGESVLDLACGTGLVAHLAKERVGAHGHVVGVDISEGMLDVARRKCRQNELNIVFIQHDISDLSGLELPPNGSNGFNIITCATALILLLDPLQAIKQWAALLKPGGRFITDVPVKDANVPIRIMGLIGDQVGQSLRWDQTWVKSEDSLKTLLADAGLIVKDVFMSKTYQVREYEEMPAPQVFE
jgi:ubiquinone/menaquinone biosynthesis C-methylase UbiE